MSYHTIVSKSGTTYYAKDRNGNALYSGSSAVTAIQTGLDRKGIVHIQNANYAIDGRLWIRSDTRVIVDQAARLQVASGYSDNVWYFHDGVVMASVEGGTVEELGTQQHLWNAVTFHSLSEGIFFNTVRDMKIWGPSCGIKLSTDSADGYIFNNVVDNLQIWHATIFIDFEVGVAEPLGIHRNMFRDVLCQAASNVQYGARNIRHSGNMFINTIFWDLHSTAVSASVDSTAIDTVIVNGAMTHNNYVDNGIRTTILGDEWKKVRFGMNANVVIGKATLATNAIEGFLHIPTMAGAPVGSPQAWAGTSPMVYDTTNKKIWIRNTAMNQWKSIALT